MANDLYGMKTFPLTLGDEEFMIFVAADDPSRRLGLSELEAIEEDEGMLFVFPAPGKHQMWMKATEFPLDILFLNSELKVIEIVSAKEMDETLVGEQEDTKFVIELPAGSVEKYELEVGDVIYEIPPVYLEPVEDPDKPLKVLNSDGSVQAELKGGERIFSRESTKNMIDAAKVAEDDAGMIKLAKIVLGELNAQNDRPEEHTGEDAVTYEKKEDGGVIKIE